MILLIILITCQAQNHKGILQINQTLKLNTNFTEIAHSIIIKFDLSQIRERDSIVACFVSNLDLESQIFDIQNLKLSHENQIVYDLHSIQSNSNFQLVEYFYYNTLYLVCQSQVISKIDYELIYKEDFYKADCINECQGYNFTKSKSRSYCQFDHCECQINQIGYFCQLPSSYILSSDEQDLVLDPYQWSHFYYQYKSLDLQLLSNISIDDKTVCKYVLILTLRDIPQLEIPNLSNSKILSNNVSLIDELSKLNQSNFDYNILYIGLFNNKSSKAEFNFEIVSNSLTDYGQLEKNKIIIIVVGTVVGVLLLITCVLSYLKTKKLQKEQQQIFRLRQIRVIQNNQVDDPRLKNDSNGFSQQFIKDYFDVIAYKKLVEIYPGLNQFEDCVICLESIKNGKKKQQRNCSVTPCFHIFHQKCLSSWLEKQKNCPFCRTEFTTIIIKMKYPWLDLKQQKVNNTNQNESKYIENIKKISQTDQSQDNQLNESQQELVKKDSLVVDV